MAVNDFTGQNIQNTYQRVVQTDGTNLADGTGSILPLTFEGNNVKISGSLIANEYVVSSSVTNISIATLSGSTTFGDSVDDTHVFTGNITASGDISASGTIEAQNFLLGSVGGIFVKDISGNTDDTAIANIADSSIIFGDTDINSTIRGDTIILDANGDIRIDSATGLIRFQDSTVDSIVFNAQNGVGQITASGNVSSSGEIIAASGSFEIIHGGTF